MASKIFNSQGRRLPTDEEEFDAQVFVNRCGRVCRAGELLALFVGAYQMLKEQLETSRENYDR